MGISENLCNFVKKENLLIMFFLIFLKFFLRAFCACGELLHKFLSIVSVMGMLYNACL